MFEYGEAHLRALLTDLKDLPAITESRTHSPSVSWKQIWSVRSLRATKVRKEPKLVAHVKEQMRDLWPDNGFIEHERYDQWKAGLDEVKCWILENLARTDKERA